MFLKLPTRIEFDRQLSEGTVLYSDGSKIDVTDKVINNALRLNYLINKHEHSNSSVDSESIVIEENILKSAFLHIEGSNSLEIMDKLLRFKKGSCNIFLPYLIPFNYTDLFDFQKDGVEWLYRNKKALLADDMGLGKSVQVIAAINHIYNSKKDKASQEKTEEDTTNVIDIRRLAGL